MTNGFIPQRKTIKLSLTSPSHIKISQVVFVFQKNDTETVLLSMKYPHSPIYYTIQNIKLKVKRQVRAGYGRPHLLILALRR